MNVTREELEALKAEVKVLKDLIADIEERITADERPTATAPPPGGGFLETVYQRFYGRMRAARDASKGAK